MATKKAAKKDVTPVKKAAAKPPVQPAISRSAPELPVSNHDRNVATAEARPGPPPTDAELQAKFDAEFAAGAAVTTPARDESEIRFAVEVARKGRRTKSLTEEEVTQLCDAYLKLAEGRSPRLSAEGEQEELERLREQVAWYKGRAAGNA